MRYEFKDVSSGAVMPSDKQISVIDLCQEHKYAFVFSTSIGDIVLRKLPLRLHRQIDGMISVFCPRYYSDIQRMQDIRAGIDDINKLPDELKEEIQGLASRISYATRWYLLGVMISPVIYDDEDIDRLYQMLSDEECFNLDNLLSEMIRVADPCEIDDTALVIAEKYNVAMVDKSMLENITVSQANYFVTRINMENEELAKAFNRRKD